MMRVSSGVLSELYDKGIECLYPKNPRITVGMGTCGQASGADDVYKDLIELARQSETKVDVCTVGCRGMCWAEPIVEVSIPRRPRAVFGNVDTNIAKDIFSYATGGQQPEEGFLGFIYEDRIVSDSSRIKIADGTDDDIYANAFYRAQKRIITSRCGLIEPWSAAEYVAMGGYRALESALEHDSPEEVIATVEESGLRGRGGAGFPTGRKLRAAHDAEGECKYVIVNADEGDPGAFMDRNLLESDTHAVIEGAMLAAYAIGATQGYVFIRSEYPLAIETLEKAITEAESLGIIGEHVLGSDWCFHLSLVRSSGAYVCGEVTAMIQAMEGFPGRPRRRPPHATEHGLWGMPTCVNNVETLANIPLIIMRGAEWFRGYGTAESPGTKTFSIAGVANHTGLIEVPLGTSVKDILGCLQIDDLSSVKGMQIGGPSGIIIPIGLDLKLDYEGLESVGGAIGSGGIIFLGKESCVIDTVRYFIDFSLRESCGQCKACDDALRRCLAILTRLTEGEAEPSELDELEVLSERIPSKALCGAGKMSVRPILSSLKYFRDEYEAHLTGHCLGLICRSLIHFEVESEKCPGCRCCVPTCPTNAMQGRFGKPYHIVSRLCSRCRMCISSCPYHAVRLIGSRAEA